MWKWEVGMRPSTSSDEAKWEVGMRNAEVGKRVESSKLKVAQTEKDG
jgi:hypothetical protein